MTSRSGIMRSFYVRTRTTTINAELAEHAENSFGSASSAGSAFVFRSRVLDAVSVADRFDVRRRGAHRLDHGAQAIDDAPQVAVADGLAPLAERDHLAIDVLDLGGRHVEPDRLAALLHGVAARMASEHEPRRRLSDVLRPHDLVRARILQHSVLVDAGFVREGVASDDRFVGLHRLLREARQELTGFVE